MRVVIFASGTVASVVATFVIRFGTAGRPPRVSPLSPAGAGASLSPAGTGTLVQVSLMCSL